jgi:hypothetical protein
VRLFGRGRGGRTGGAGPLLSPEGGRPDPSLPMLTVDEAAWLAALVRTAFAEHGRETTPDGSGGLRGDGQTYGLHNLAAHVVAVPRRAWPDVARRHVRDMVAADRTPHPTSLDEVRDQVLLKLRAVSELPSEPPSYAPEVLPGIVAVAAIDYPTHVSELLDNDRLTPLGGWDAVRPVALENLRRLEPPHVEDIVSHQGDPTSIVHVMVADDFFGAARVCVLEQVLASTLGVERPRHGVLVAVPNRHVMAVHVPTGPGILPALNTLAALAAGESVEAPGPVSPYVFLMTPGGRVEQVTARGEDGELVVDATGALADVMDALGVLDLGDDEDD